MVSFLYWNTHRKPLHAEIGTLAEAHQVDVIILSEWGESPAGLLESLNAGGTQDFQYAAGECERIKIFTRFPSGSLTLKAEDDYFSIRRLKLQGSLEILLVAAHFPSKLFRSGETQEGLCREVARTITKLEEQVKHNRTLLVGDLNMNPFEKGMVGADGMNAVMSRQVASRKSRTIMSKVYPFFFNPM